MAKGKNEDDYSAKLDMCLTDGIVKTGKYSYVLSSVEVQKYKLVI